MSKVLAFLEARLTERSTWLGLLGLLGDFGVHLRPDLTGAIATAGVALGGVVMVITKDANPAA